MEGKSVTEILISGALAYDQIGSFSGKPDPSVHNVKLDRLQPAFGGCAINIAANLRSLGRPAAPFVYAGANDYRPYRRHLRRIDVSDAGVQVIADEYCARALILTGSDGGQFTAFYPGPETRERYRADLQRWLTGREFAAVIVAPDHPANLLAVTELAPRAALWIWSPGQYASALSGAQIEALLTPATLLVVNRDEWDALCHAAGEALLRQRLPGILITDGPRPVRILPAEQRIDVPAVPGARDPTGCGDAFVAAVCAALLDGTPLDGAVAAGIRLAAQCIAHEGAQSHLGTHGMPRQYTGSGPQQQ